MSAQEQPIGITDATSHLRPKVDTNRFRRRRFQLVLDRLRAMGSLGRPIRILDIGGVIPYWEGVGDLWAGLPLEITIINLGAPEVDRPPFFVRDGNACSLPQYPDNSFDLVHSNSVIEHVGQWHEMSLMAREIRRLAPSYFIQTPNFWFPMEPHYRTLFFHWYPEVVRAEMLLKKRRGFTEKLTSLDEAMRNVQSVRMLTRGQMAELFPDGRIVEESFFGFAKSVMAIR